MTLKLASRTVFEALTILAGLLLLGWALWEQKRYTGSQRSRERAELATFCAWCVHRSGETCTNPGSPIYEGSLRAGVHWGSGWRGA